MKLTNIEIEQILNGLDKAITDEEGNKKQLPLYLNKRIRTTRRELKAIVDEFNETRSELLQKYAKRDDDGNIMQGVDQDGNRNPNSVQLEDPQKFQEEWNSLATDENEVHLSAPIKEEDFDFEINDEPFLIPNDAYEQLAILFDKQEKREMEEVKEQA